jgi:hypothetical protein
MFDTEQIFPKCLPEIDVFFFLGRRLTVDIMKGWDPSIFPWRFQCRQRILFRDCDCTHSGCGV